MNLTRCATFALCLAALPQLPALGQAQKETLTLEIDVFSGFPNPRVELSSGELLGLLSKLAPRCGRGTVRELDYPATTLGYRGLRITAAADGQHAEPRFVLARKQARIAKRSDSSVCGSELAKSMGALVVDDDGNALERQLVELAYRKGVIPEALYRVINESIDAEP
jgi:hypothetical protein